MHQEGKSRTFSTHLHTNFRFSTAISRSPFNSNHFPITCIRDLIAENGNASRKAIIWRVIGVVTCVPLSIFINRKIAKPFNHYLHHTTILTYILLAVTFAVGIFLIIKGHQHKRYISNIIKMKEMNENGKK